ncbi:TonB-dependent receptor [Hyphomonas sp. WL0036]|uniref:TonB-dependent receptor domain-containing protein n=1 Tax=Hyphomonas sediminis TaxID=2866160 RepID=UPI001C7E6F49|nr:TonB-dependent receptor [Hyphomonas sediminis]MBY9066198.1 TonB-dependent receptor [Hyphomonas sediminis]
MKYFKGALLYASAIALSGAMVVHAQEQDEGERKLSTVTVTGSMIQGTPEDAALPVDVLTAGDLKLEGSPSITELIRNLGVSSGVDGQTNQFASNGLEGTSNVNLRGLGPARTLVLINGRRQTYAPYSIGEQAQLFVDTNMIPSAAIGRIEVLKDGAAAIYGSDAIAGVANFITNTDLKGLEVSGTFSTFEGNDDGDYELSAAYGFQGENWNWITSAGYQYRSEVPLTEKDWGTPSFAENPVAGYSSISNPGRFVTIGPVPGGGVGVNGNVADVGCVPLGGVLGPDNQCRFQFTQFDNLVEKEERFQIFSEYNRTTEFGDLHFEVLYGKTDVPEWKTSPSYPPQVLTNQVILPTHPGWQQYILDNPGTALDTAVQALFIGRSYGWGGFPDNDYGPQVGSREYETWRASGGLKGQWDNGVNYDVGLSYSTTEGYRSTNDTYVQGLTLALRGFGVCTDPITGFDPATGTSPLSAGYTGTLAAGAGTCQYYNPFSNSIPAGAITGTPNPQYNPALANTAELADWMTDASETTVTTDLMVLDAVLSGESSVQAAGGAVGWAFGAQVRRESYEVVPSALTDLNATPGPGGTGPYSFLAGTTGANDEQTIYAVFGEVQIPLFEDVGVQVAMRYEDYGGDIGSTFDPKFAAKWQVNDMLALRGSAQTSFRGPTLNQLGGVGTTLQFVAPASAFKAVDQYGNPSLDPESAFSFNLGALFETGNFHASLDYYNFDFSDPIIVEEQSNIVNAAVAALAANDLSNPILNRITFQDPLNPTAATIARVRTGVVNGPDIQTSGLDFRAENMWEGLVAGADLSAGVDATYIIEYVVAPYFVEGVSIGGGDYVGQFNRSNFTRSMPQWKANVFANLAFGDHNIRGVMRHIDSYKDERPAALRGGVYPEISSQTTFDLFYNYTNDNWGIDVGLGVVNLTDEDPPPAAFDTNYDPYTHNPFGRTFRLTLTKRFGGD